MLLVVRPFAREAALALVVAVVATKDDDGVVGHAHFIEVLDHAVHDVVDSADHSEVGT